MNKQRWGIAATGVGLGLLCLWAVCSFLLPTAVFWDEQDQQVYAEAAERQHQAGHRLERALQTQRDLEAAQQELQASQQQMEAEQNRLAAAQSRITWLPRLLLGGALAAIVAGLVLLAR
jgi:hypothetical protein